MKTAQDALIQHVEAAGLGFSVVKPYAGEIKAEAEGRPGALTHIMPCALVMYAAGAVSQGQGRYALDVLVAVATQALDVQAAASDGLGLAEALVRHLDDNPLWRYDADDGTAWAYQLAGGDAALRADLLLLTLDYTIVRVSVPVVEIEG